MLEDFNLFILNIALLRDMDVQTHKEVVEGEKVDLERRAQRLARRIEEERTLKETERLAHESGIRAIRAQVGSKACKVSLSN